MRALPILLTLALVSLASCSNGDGQNTTENEESADSSGDDSAGEDSGGPADMGDPAGAEACQLYIDCTAALGQPVTPVVALYGEDGTCWDEFDAELCIQDCQSFVRALHTANPDEEACRECESDEDCEGWLDSDGCAEVPGTCAEITECCVPGEGCDDFALRQCVEEEMDENFGCGSSSSWGGSLCQPYVNSTGCGVCPQAFEWVCDCEEGPCEGEGWPGGIVQQTTYCAVDELSQEITGAVCRDSTFCDGGGKTSCQGCTCEKTETPCP